MGIEKQLTVAFPVLVDKNEVYSHFFSRLSI